MADSGDKTILKVHYNPNHSVISFEERFCSVQNIRRELLAIIALSSLFVLLIHVLLIYSILGRSGGTPHHLRWSHLGLTTTYTEGSQKTIY